MAEQRTLERILGSAAGDIQYLCVSLKVSKVIRYVMSIAVVLFQEVELFEAAFYGLEERVQHLILQKVFINCVYKVG